MRYVRHDKKRYVFIVKYAKIEGNTLLFFYRKLFGDILTYRSSPKIIYERDGWLVVRVNHRYLPQIRAATLMCGPGSLYTLLVSGSLRALLRKLRSRIEGKSYVEELAQAYLEHKKTMRKV